MADEVYDYPEWRSYARCRGEFETMMPRGRPGGGPMPGIHEQIARARAICAQCSVVEPCLEYALSCGPQGGPAKDGVWAGCTPEDLRAIARARRLARAS